MKHKRAKEQGKKERTALLRGKSIKDNAIERTLGKSGTDTSALQELEELLDTRIHAACAGAIGRRTVSEIFDSIAQ